MENFFDNIAIFTGWKFSILCTIGFIFQTWREGYSIFNIFVPVICSGLLYYSTSYLKSLDTEIDPKSKRDILLEGPIFEYTTLIKYYRRSGGAQPFSYERGTQYEDMHPIRTYYKKDYERLNASSN